MESKVTENWWDSRARERFQTLAPLLDKGTDNARKVQLRRTIASDSGISEKTLRRWEKRYAEEGFAGLRPSARSSHYTERLPQGFGDILDEAVQLKREVPTRSVSQIIFILEGEGKAAPGVLKRSTLQRHLYDAGFGYRQMHKYTEGLRSSSRRFCKPHRMMLLQAVNSES